MRVLVTGSAGFIGSAVRRRLEQRGDIPVGFDHPATILDRGAVAAAVESCDAVINLAGVLGTSELLGAERYAAEVNVIGAVNVFDAARGKPVVQIGTGHRGQLNTYAVTKACAEDLALGRAQWAGEPITVVRAFHAYGPGQKPCPPHGHSPVRKIIPSFVCRALTGMPIEVWGDGKQVIDLVHVDDVAAALVAGLGGPYGSVIDAGTGYGTTVVDCAELVVELTGSDAGVVYLPMRAGEPERDTVVAQQPWPCEWALRSGLEATIPWYREYLS